MESGEEDKLLPSTAIQSAKSFMSARQRAEEELVRAKEALELKTEQLAHSLAMTRATLEATTDGFLATDADGKVTDFNRRYAEMWGLPVEILTSKEHRLIQEFCSRQFRDPNQYLATIDEIYRTSPPESFDVLELLDDRVFERFSRIQFVAERNMGRVWSFRDLTERRRAEQARFHLAAVVASSDDAIISKDLNGIIRSWNDGAERIFGYSAAEMIGKSITMLLPAHRLHEEVEILRRLKRGERVEHFDTVRIHKTGRPIDVSVAISPIRDSKGQVIGASKIARDISSRKRMEQTNRFLVETNAALVELTDYESTLQKVASLSVPFFADWCAVDMKEADGSVRRLAVKHSDAIEVHVANELEHSRANNSSHPFGIRNVLRTGRSAWTAELPETRLGLKSYICVPLRDRTHTIGALTFATTAGRAYTVDDLRAAEDVAHRVVIAIENANLLFALKESDRRKDEFLAMLAHELRNPLAPIRNALQILRLKKGKADLVQAASEMMERQVSQLVRLVDDLLDVSRISRGKIELRRERVELGSVINHAVEAARALVQCMEHDLTVMLSPQPIYLFADPTRLTQVLGNLLNNACKFMEKGGRIWLTVDRETRDRRPEAVIRVRDTGVGIAAEHLPRIFEMFTQLDTTLERSQSGLGIGLSLAKNLVELHGGTLEAYSAGKGMGSEFIVRLSISEDVPVSIPEQADKDQTPPAARRVLIVDDNCDTATSLAMLFKMDGNETRIACDGVEAVETAAIFRPDVVLLDIGLPKLNGYDAAHQIREQPWGEKMVLVALTGWGQEEDRQKSKEAGFDAHMIKPIKYAVLTKLLGELPARD